MSKEKASRGMQFPQEYLKSKQIHKVVKGLGIFKNQLCKYENKKKKKKVLVNLPEFFP